MPTQNKTNKNMATPPKASIKHFITAKLTILSFLFASTATPLNGQITYEQIIEQALIASQNDEIDQADSLFRQALKLNPSDMRNALIYYNIALLQLKKGDKMKALDHLTTAVGITPHNIPILKARADLYLQLGNQGKALRDYTTIIDLAPNHQEALLARAFIYQQRREYYNAQQDYQQLLATHPDNYAALLGIAILFQNAGKPKEAITRLSLLIDQYPDKA